MRLTNRKVAVGLLAVVVGVSASGFAGLLGDSCTEIDVNSGHVRHRVLVFGIVVSESAEETAFSRAVAQTGLQTAPADYRFAGSNSVGLQKLFGSLYVCSKYGDAIATLHNMMIVFEIQPALRENERDILGKLLSLLRAGDEDGMHDFVDSLDALSQEAATEPP